MLQALGPPALRAVALSRGPCGGCPPVPCRAGAGPFPLVSALWASIARPGALGIVARARQIGSVARLPPSPSSAASVPTLCGHLTAKGGAPCPKPVAAPEIVGLMAHQNSCGRQSTGGGRPASGSVPHNGMWVGRRLAPIQLGLALAPALTCRLFVDGTPTSDDSRPRGNRSSRASCARAPLS